MEKLDFIDSKFRLAILAAKRGKQLVNGAKRKIEIAAENPLTIALKEIYDGKVNFRILEEGEEPRFHETYSEYQKARDEEQVEDLLFSRDDDEDEAEDVEAIDMAADDDDENVDADEDAEDEDKDEDQ